MYCYICPPYDIYAYVAQPLSFSQNQISAYESINMNQS